MFHEVPAGAIKTLFDEQNQSLFTRAHLGKYFGIEKIISRTFHHITLTSDWT